MAEKSEREMISEIYTVLLGVPDTDDDGVVGDIKETRDNVTKINSRLRKAETSISDMQAYEQSRDNLCSEHNSRISSTERKLSQLFIAIVVGLLAILGSVVGFNVW